ncbi:MAG: hypothetical protein HFG54_13035 [Lachnospiraceae bacterium]|jgi:hypothetical protein|nr:hypothetical protein [Lachnospiraceae bacterium]
MAKRFITYGDHKGGVRARMIVEYIDGFKGQLETYGGSKREAKINLEEKGKDITKLIGISIM